MAIFWGATAALAVVLSAICVIDLRSFRIPDILSLPLIVAGLVLAWGFPLLPLQHHLIGAGAGYAVLAAIGWWYHRRTGDEGLGLGDAKLFAASGAWLGWQALPAVLLIAALGGLGFAGVRGQWKRRSGLAFGPWLALGFMAVWLWQNAALGGL